jgi:hypothetical protein
MGHDPHWVRAQWIQLKQTVGETGLVFLQGDWPPFQDIASDGCDLMSAVEARLWSKRNGLQQLRLSDIETPKSVGVAVITATYDEIFALLAR